MSLSLIKTQSRTVLQGSRPALPTVGSICSPVRTFHVTRFMWARAMTSLSACSSNDIPERLQQHTDAKRRPSGASYTSVKHTRRGHELMPASALLPYKSNSLSHRLIIETCLISLCKTVKGNKSSANNRDMNILAPIILRSAPLDWKAIAAAQPNMSPEIAPRKYQRFFSSTQHQRPHEITHSSLDEPHPGYPLRSRSHPDLPPGPPRD